MNKNSLKSINNRIRKLDTVRKMRVRSIASSTAIETGESISKIEAKLNSSHLARHRVKLG
jgi:hypothetical protein